MTAILLFASMLVPANGRRRVRAASACAAIATVLGTIKDDLADNMDNIGRGGAADG
ncbi:hypothetical protein [Sphingomonas sp.]|uniref:hypothetical protein n=1 Tax=Sphingomonas sp. TaxID=28214 RepID=UPI003CC6B729